MMEATKNQIVKIHIAKQQLDLTESDYRNILQSFGVSSSKELSSESAGKLLDKFIQAGWKPKSNIPKDKDLSNWGKNKYNHLDKRSREYARPNQLRKIEALWREISYSKSDQGLNKIIKRIIGVDHIEWLKIEDVNKVIKGLNEIRKAGEKKNEKDTIVKVKQN